MTFIEYLTGWNVAAVVCLLVGIALLVIEMFTPGLGAPGIMGFIALVAAVVLRADSVMSALITVAIVIVILGVCGVFIIRSFKKGRLQKSQFVLKESISSGSTEMENADMLALVGKRGVVLNTLRPSGNAEIDDKKIDVVSDGEFINKGSEIEVVRVEGVRVLVREVEK